VIEGIGLIISNKGDIEKRGKVLKTLLIICLLLLIVFLVYNSVAVYEQEQEKFKNRLNGSAQLFLNETEAFFNSYVSLFNGMAHTDSVINKDTVELFSYFERVDLRYPEIENIAAVDEDGFFFGSGKPFDIDNPPNVSHLGFFKKAITTEKGYVIMEPHTGPISGRGVTGLVIRLEDENKKFRGILGGSIRFDALENHWNKFSDVNGMKILSFRENGDVLISSRGKWLESIGYPFKDGVESYYKIDGIKYYSLELFVEELSSPVILFKEEYIPYIESFFENPLIVFIFVFLSITIAILLFLQFRETGILRLLIESQKNNMSSTAKFQAIFEAIPDAILFIDPDNLCIISNSAFSHIFGYNSHEIIGQSIEFLFSDPSDMLENYQRDFNVLQENENPFRKINYKRKDGNIFPGETLGFPVLDSNSEKIGFLYLIRDICDKIKMEEMMVQNEKMLSIGGLAAGMAHEINNPLGAIIQTANVIGNRLINKIDTPPNLIAAEKAGISIEGLNRFMELRDIPRMFSSINEAGLRMSEIINNMLTFTRRSGGRVTSEDFSRLLTSTLDLAHTDFDINTSYDFEKIKIKKVYENNIPLVPCVKTEIQQVILNIVRNGAQALLEAGTENPQLLIRMHYEEKIKMVIIEIEDNGPGIAEEIRKKIFEPFFTTKSVGSGTGLGLSVSYFIITRNHRGDMRVESEMGVGTRFIIRLPLSHNE